MSDKNYAFSGGVDAISGYGQRDKLLFGGAWLDGETWTAAFASTVENFTLGAGVLINDPDGNRLPAPTTAFTFKNKVYLGLGSQFNFSDNGDPTAWEEQDPGAGFIVYLSQIGGQDTVKAFSQLQGRLAVLARRSVQLWTVDADPANYTVVQILDNVGTPSLLSARNLGDYDVIFYDDTGVRSLRLLETTLNARIDDLGSQVDEIIRKSIDGFDVTTICAAVPPDTRDFWVYIAGTIYVYCRNQASKISAWATYSPRDHTGVIFTPLKFVILNGVLYCRTVEQTLIIYGGVGANLFDGSVITVETPWHDNKHPSTIKKSVSLDAIIEGNWQISGGMDPKSGVLEPIYGGGDIDNPSAAKDSTFDQGSIPWMTMGTHYKLRAVSSSQGVKQKVLSAFIFKDQRGEII